MRKMGAFEGFEVPLHSPMLVHCQEVHSIWGQRAGGQIVMDVQDEDALLFASQCTVYTHRA